MSMGTCYFPCGCSITRTMFGDCPLFAVRICFEHALQQKAIDACRALTAAISAIRTAECECAAGQPCLGHYTNAAVQEALEAMAESAREANRKAEA